MSLFKKLVSHLPSRWQDELKRIYFSKQIKKNAFVTDEPEFLILHELVSPDDWVIDIGANIGHYTKRLSDLVGSNGRVIAFEPVPTTFSLLASNVQLFSNSNVSLINAAVSDKLDVVGMSLPKFSTGLTNYYEANISSSEDSELSVLTISVDSLKITTPISLIKIDAEGHEAFVLAGMKELIKNYFPDLIIECPSKEIDEDLISLGYVSKVYPGSPNVLFRKNNI